MEGKYSPEEVDNFVNLGAKLSSKAVLAALKETVKWAADKIVIVKPAAADATNDDISVAAAAPILQRTPDELAARSRQAEVLCDEIDAATPYSYSGFTQVEMVETPMKLNISLVLVPLDHKPSIVVPSKDYINDIFAQYDFLKKVAIAYWATWCEKHPGLSARINEFCGFDLGALYEVIPEGSPSGTTLCWHEEVPNRVGVFCYYVDSAGRPMVHRDELQSAKK